MIAKFTHTILSRNLLLPGIVLIINCAFGADTDSLLNRIVEVQSEIKQIHPHLENFYPIAIVKENRFYIHEFDSTQNRYQLKKEAPVVNPLPKNIAASFPLQAFDYRPACVLSYDLIEQPDIFVTVFHEFMHCAQMQTDEQELKSKLQIHQQAMSVNNYMWEITHPFPYDDSVFIQNYGAFLTALKSHDSDGIKKSRTILADHLSKVDYEYMCWQEWKEGFARMIENDIRKMYNLAINDAGRESPIDRITFYYGGEHLIRYLETQNLELLTTPVYLFTVIQSLEKLGSNNIKEK